MKDSKGIGKELYDHSVYDTVERFLSYQKQVELIRKTQVKRILNIGSGTGFLKSYLKDIKVFDCDIDKNLKPDIVSDIRKINVKSKSFELVCAYQILEHIPLSDLELALKELRRVSNKYVIISVPYGVKEQSIVFKGFIPQRLNGKELLELSYKKELKNKTYNVSGYHYWEMGYKEMPKDKFKKILSKYFYIIQESSPILNSYHYFFVLRCKE